MTADELADEMEAYEDAGMFMKQAATMLLQQQAEIEHLKQLFGCDPAYFEPDKKVKTLTDEEITIVKEAVGNYVCTIKMEIDQEKQTFKGYEHCSNLPALKSELKDAEQALAILKKASK